MVLSLVLGAKPEDCLVTDTPAEVSVRHGVVDGLVHGDPVGAFLHTKQSSHTRSTTTASVGIADAAAQDSAT